MFTLPCGPKRFLATMTWILRAVSAPPLSFFWPSPASTRCMKMTASASCSIEPEPRKSDSFGGRAEVVAPFSASRDICDKASTGILSSRAMTLSTRLISLTFSYSFMSGRLALSSWR